MDIEKLRKEMTREEFLKYERENNEQCPSDFELKDIYCSEKDCIFNFECEKCWEKSVKDIKFKDDIEVKKLSKELNILQAIEMPIGTRFDFDIETNGVSDFIEVMKGNEEPKILCWNGDKHSRVNVCSSTSVIKLTVIQQPVSFMEVVNSKKLCRVDLSDLGLPREYNEKVSMFNKKYYESFGGLMYGLTNKFGTAILKQIIKEGKWYLKESEVE